ncbi:hypothetical protein [Halobacillus seohaensis]|uniref:hypothetical protein n=1 Tax=Halobacillus seohaensis TaxID=447421 RepID=UPI0019584817
METIYWIFIISVVIATFFIIFKKLTKSSYFIIITIGVLYAVILIASFIIP